MSPPGSRRTSWPSRRPSISGSRSSLVGSYHPLYPPHSRYFRKNKGDAENECRSLGACIAADLCTANVPLGGVIYIAALPYTGELMYVVGTPTILGLIPGLMSDGMYFTLFFSRLLSSEDTIDAATALQTRLDFCKIFVAASRFDSVPYTEYMRWVGVTCRIPPVMSRLALTRPQDPAGLFAAGQKGLPLLILNGRDDLQVKGDEVTKAMSPHFPHLEEVWLEGVGHMPSYE
jgi:hypothetical protein